MAKTSVIVFDLDDTLYSKSDVFYQTFCAFATPPIDPIALYQLYQDHSDVAFELFSSKQMSLINSHRMRIRDTFESLGLEIDDATIDAFRERYQYNLEHIQLPKEWQEGLQLLLDKGYTLALLTNGPTDHQSQKLHQLQLKQWITQENWFISETLGFKKPDIRCFQAVEAALPATEYWMVGDYVTNDVQGALNAGWNSIHFLGYRPSTSFEEASHLAYNANDVLQIITQ